MIKGQYKGTNLEGQEVVTGFGNQITLKTRLPSNYSSKNSFIIAHATLYVKGTGSNNHQAAELKIGDY